MSAFSLYPVRRNIWLQIQNQKKIWIQNRMPKSGTTIWTYKISAVSLHAVRRWIWLQSRNQRKLWIQNWMPKNVGHNHMNHPPVKCPQSLQCAQVKWKSVRLTTNAAKGYREEYWRNINLNEIYMKKKKLSEFFCMLNLTISSFLPDITT